MKFLVSTNLGMGKDNMTDYIGDLLKKPSNSCSYKELLLQSGIVTVLSVILGLFAAIFLGKLLSINFVSLFISFCLCFLLNFLWVAFKPIFEKKIRYVSDFGEDKIHYEARSSLLLLFGIMAGIFVTSIFYLKGFLFIQCVGIFLSFVFPVLVIFLRRDYYYNENGKLNVENDYEFAYDIQILYGVDIFIGFATLGSSFALLAGSCYISYPPFHCSVIFIFISTMLFYAILCPDFWNRYLPFDVKKRGGLISYLLICGLIVFIINRIVWGQFI